MGECPALLIVDFVNGFPDPDMFGGGNIPKAAECTVALPKAARGQSLRYRAEVRPPHERRRSDQSVLTGKRRARSAANAMSSVSAGPFAQGRKRMRKARRIAVSSASAE